MKQNCIVRLVVFMLFALVVSSANIGCNQHDVVNSQVDANTGTVTTNVLLERIGSLLKKETATPEDLNFIMSLSDSEMQSIVEYYEKYPMFPLDSSEFGRGLDKSQDVEANWIGEEIECRDGFGGWVASSWMHTTACGGDGNDHFYYYPGVPGAYVYRGYLQGRSVHPGVLMTLARYGWRLSARVYSSGSVYICVGVSMHIFGVTHETWRTSFNLYRVR